MIRPHVARVARDEMDSSKQFFHAIKVEREIFFRATCAHQMKTIRGNFRGPLPMPSRASRSQSHKAL
jgi:hypothetical protein